MGMGVTNHAAKLRKLFGSAIILHLNFSLIHKTTADLRNRHPEGLHLGLVLGGGFCYSPLIVEPDYTLTA